MKNFTIALLLLTFINLYAQTPSIETKEYNRNIYTYNTYQDYINDQSVYVGDFFGTQWNDLGVNKLIIANTPSNSKESLALNTLKESKTKSINTNKFWGYKIDNFIFRMKKNGSKLPVVIIKSKGKVFYIEGYIYLNMIRNNTKGGYSFRNFESQSSSIFYSDTFESKIYDIKKLVNAEKNNETFSELTKCLRSTKKIYEPQVRFKKRIECIRKF